MKSKLNRAQSSRINGAKSKGPTSESGKRTCSQNAVKHGMYTGRVVLSNESQEIYDRIKALYLECWQPVDLFEYEQVETLINCRWRIRRLEAVETATVHLTVLEQRAAVETKLSNVDPRTEQALAYRVLADSDLMEKHSRFEERLHRTFERALRNLFKYRRNTGRALPQTETLRCAEAALPPNTGPFEGNKPEIAQNFPLEQVQTPARKQNPPPTSKPPQPSAISAADFPSGGLQSLLDRHPQLRRAVLKALQEDRLRGVA